MAVTIPLKWDTALATITLPDKQLKIFTAQRLHRQLGDHGRWNGRLNEGVAESVVFVG